MERIVCRKGKGGGASYFRKIVIKEEGGPEYMKNVEDMPELINHAKLLMECQVSGLGITPMLQGASSHNTLGEGLLALLSVAAPSQCTSLATLAVHSGHFPPIKWEVCASKTENKPFSLAVVPASDCHGSWLHSDWCYPATMGESKQLVVPLFAKVGAVYIYSQEEASMMSNDVLMSMLMNGTSGSLGTRSKKSGGEHHDKANRWKFSGMGYGACVASACVLLMPLTVVDSLVTFGSPATFSHPEGVLPFPHTHIQHAHDLVPHLNNGTLLASSIARMEGFGFLFPKPPFERLNTYRGKHPTMFSHPTNHVYILYPMMVSYTTDMKFVKDGAGKLLLGSVNGGPRNHERENVPSLEFEGKNTTYDARLMHPYVMLRDYLISVRLVGGKKVAQDLNIITRLAPGWDVLTKFVNDRGELFNQKASTDLLQLQKKGLGKDAEVAWANEVSERKMRKKREAEAEEREKQQQQRDILLERDRIREKAEKAAEARAIAEGRKPAPLPGKASNNNVDTTSSKRKSSILSSGSDSQNDMSASFQSPLEGNPAASGSFGGAPPEVATIKEFTAVDARKLRAKFKSPSGNLSRLELSLLRAPKLVNALWDQRNNTGDTNLQLPDPDDPVLALHLTTSMQQSGDGPENLAGYFKQFTSVSCWDPRMTAKQLIDWGGDPPLRHSVANRFILSNRLIFACSTPPRRAHPPRHLSTPDAHEKISPELLEFLRSPDGFHVSWPVILASTVHSVGKSTLIETLQSERLGTSYRASSSSSSSSMAASYRVKPTLVGPLGDDIIPFTDPMELSCTSAQSASMHMSASDSPTHKNRKKVGFGGTTTMSEIDQEEEAEVRETVMDQFQEPSIHVKWAPIIGEKQVAVQKENVYGGRRKTTVVGAPGSGPESILIRMNLVECFYAPKSRSARSVLASGGMSLWVVSDEYSFNHLIKTIDFAKRSGVRVGAKSTGSDIPVGTVPGIILAVRKHAVLNPRLETNILEFCARCNVGCAIVSGKEVSSCGQLQRLMAQWMIPKLNMPFDPALLPPCTDLGSLVMRCENTVGDYLKRSCAYGPLLGGRDPGVPDPMEQSTTNEGMVPADANERDKRLMKDMQKSFMKGDKGAGKNKPGAEKRTVGDGGGVPDAFFEDVMAGDGDEAETSMRERNGMLDDSAATSPILPQKKRRKTRTELMEEKKEQQEKEELEKSQMRSPAKKGKVPPSTKGTSMNSTTPPLSGIKQQKGGLSTTPSKSSSNQRKDAVAENRSASPPLPAIKGAGGTASSSVGSPSRSKTRT